jgi:hypothetical protein
MPYELKKSSGGCQVKAKDTGKTFSKKPIPCKRAKSQMRLLYSKMKENREGNGKK